MGVVVSRLLREHNTVQLSDEVVMLTRLSTLVIVLAFLNSPSGLCQSGSPAVYSQNGQFLGNLNGNRFDPNSTSNPYGQYGSPYSPNSINNPYGQYGSRYSPQGATNPYGSTSSPEVYGSNGTYLGRMNTNRFDPNSVANPYGQYGSPYLPNSINNQYGTYGSPYSPQGANNPYGVGQGPSEVEPSSFDNSDGGND